MCFYAAINVFRFVLVLFTVVIRRFIVLSLLLKQRHVAIQTLEPFFISTPAAVIDAAFEFRNPAPFHFASGGHIFRVLLFHIS